MAPETCPNCGAEVPANARACPECGSDEQTGWSGEAQTGGLDLPEEHFNYEDYVAREFGSRRLAPRGVPWFWWVVGLLAVGAFLAFSFWWR